MMAYVYLQSEHQVPKSRSPLYQEVIKGILARSEEKGLIEFDRSDKVSLLALLARWMQNNEIYVVSPARISCLIDRWVISGDDRFQFAHLRCCDQLRLRNELIQSGLLRTTLDGDVEFIHPTFRAYLAALTVSVDELTAIVGKSAWRTSLILWASLREICETDVLVNLLIEHPLLLGQVMRERAERRDGITLSKAELQKYFKRMNRFFHEFVRQFPIFLKNPPWKSLTEKRLKLVVAQSSATGYVLTWQSSENDIDTIRWTTCTELCQLVENTDSAFPLPLWLLPTEIIQKYHSLEVVYLWVVRSLFDLLVFAGWKGGLDVSDFGQQVDSHPAIALIANRFLLCQEFASGLPREIRDQLPFYCNKEYDLAIEVHEFLTPPIVRYAVVPGHEPGHVSIVQSILKEPDDASLLFRRDEDGYWHFQVDKIARKVSSVEQVIIGQLMTESPGSWAQRRLRAELQECLPGFPPGAW